MIILFIIGLAALGLVGLYWLEGSASMMTVWGIIAIVCLAIYFVNFISNKIEKSKQ